MEKEKKWFETEGSIQADVDEDTLNNELLIWAESKGWLFTGITKPAEEE